MADIRQNQTPLDAFDYGVGEDYLHNLNSNWQAHTAGGLAAGCYYDVDNSGYARCHSPTDTRALSRWLPLALDGDDQEVWAHEIGGSGSGKSWRLSLTKNDVFAGTYGYSFTVSVGTGGGSWFLRRYDGDATGTVISSSPGGAPTATPGWMLLRRSGNKLQGWRANSGGTDLANWTKIVESTSDDTTYMTGLYPTLWIADDAVQGHGFDYFGGGPEPDWMPEFIRRPWNYQGKALVLP